LREHARETKNATRGRAGLCWPSLRRSLTLRADFIHLAGINARRQPPAEPQATKNKKKNIFCFSPPKRKNHKKTICDQQTNVITKKSRAGTSARPLKAFGFSRDFFLHSVAVVL
jgi:hypothetical protein